jgi:hypothetical protein
MYNHGTPVTVKENKTVLTVVESKANNLEREIDYHVKSIRALISKLRPTEKQKYFNGLLAFIVHEQIEWAEGKPSEEKDYSKLSSNELSLLQELSGKMHELYQTLDFNHE